MGAELIFNGSFVCGVTSRSLDRQIEELKDDIERLDKSILAIMAASPREKPDPDYQNWEEYVTARHSELMEEYQCAVSRLALLNSAKDSVERKEDEYTLCPKCGEIMYVESQEYDEEKKQFLDRFTYKCPSCNYITGEPHKVKIPAFIDSE